MLASHCSGSTQRNRSRVWASHDQRRFIASSSSAASSGGSDGRTVKLRSAFIGRDGTPSAIGSPPWLTRCAGWWRSRRVNRCGSRRSRCPTPGPGEALVRVQACGVCHTDLHYREGAINDDFPFLLGHEAAGVVEAVGDGVSGVAVGDFVVLNWRAVCGTCRSCLRGRPWYCFSTFNATQKMTLDGRPLSPALGIGAFAEKTLVAAGQCTKVEPAGQARGRRAPRLRRDGRPRRGDVHGRGRAGRHGRRVRVRRRRRRRRSRAPDWPARRRSSPSTSTRRSSSGRGTSAPPTRSTRRRRTRSKRSGR